MILQTGFQAGDFHRRNWWPGLAEGSLCSEDERFLGGRHIFLPRLVQVCWRRKPRSWWGFGTSEPLQPFHHLGESLQQRFWKSRKISSICQASTFGQWGALLAGGQVLKHIWQFFLLDFQFFSFGQKWTFGGFSECMIWGCRVLTFSGHLSFCILPCPSVVSCEYQCGEYQKKLKKIFKKLQISSKSKSYDKCSHCSLFSRRRW